jgi:hypothetical protein
LWLWQRAHFIVRPITAEPSTSISSAITSIRSGMKPVMFAHVASGAIRKKPVATRLSYSSGVISFART